MDECMTLPVGIKDSGRLEWNTETASVCMLMGTSRACHHSSTHSSLTLCDSSFHTK